jgi:hypothetical protein
LGLLFSYILYRGRFNMTQGDNCPVGKAVGWQAGWGLRKGRFWGKGRESIP